MSVVRFTALAFLFALTLAACDRFPRDAHGTTDRVRGGRLRVGLVERSPWVYRKGHEPAGVEVQLVRELAWRLHSTVEWQWGGEEETMEALKHHELDLAIGGFPLSTPWKKEVGFTASYFENRIMVGIPASGAEPESLRNLSVAVRAGTPAGAYLERQGAKPIRLETVSAAYGAAAAPEWELRALGLSPTRFKLDTEKIGMALPPGENGWIYELDTFLSEQRPRIETLLAQEGPRP